jgi:hypothetical protein
MIRKTMRYLIGLAILLLAICIGLYYYVSQPLDSKELICFKGKLLHKIDDDENVYVKIKGITCEFEKGMIIIEEQL